MAKGAYIGVDGIARNIKQPDVGVGGVARKVKNGYIGVNGVARQFYQSGTPISTLAVGSSVYMNVNGALTEFLIVHQGVPNGSENILTYDSSCDGTWLLMKDIYKTSAWGSSNNDYENSTVHSYLNSTFLNLIDSVVQTKIKQVLIPYRKGTGSGGSDSYGEGSGLSTKVFLLAGWEVGFRSSDASNLPLDGKKLDYFGGNISIDEYNNGRIGYYNGTATRWWTRSPSKANTSYVYLVNTNGRSATYSRSTNCGIRPAMILQKDTVVDDQNMIIG